MSPSPVWLIAGPTAAGKSALALALARAYGGEIVNADSVQLYGDLRILTARPTPEDEARAPHHLFGIADAADAWSVGRWLSAAKCTLASVAERGRPAIVVGGTGLYFRSLTQGLADIPLVSPTIRSETAAMYDELGEAAFRRTLARADSAAEARIAAGDRQRLMRAFGVFAASGRPLSEWRRFTIPTLAPESWRGVVVSLPRDALYRRCNQRLAAMAEGGALAEVARLVSRGLDPNLPAMKALGLAPFAAHLRGEIDAAEALSRAQQATRQYAKRQLTWFRHQTPDWPRLDAEDRGWQFRYFLRPGLA